MQGGVPQLQTTLVILTREASVWTAKLSHNTASPPSKAADNASTLPIQAAVQVDPSLFASATPADDAAASPHKQQLYGKSICYCPATAMWVASLGNAAEEEQNVTWLMTVSTDGSGIDRLASVHVSNPPAAADSVSDSADEAEPADLQHPDPESDAEHVASEEEQDEEDESEDGSTDATFLPSVGRSYAIPVLPVSRQEMQTPGLVLGVPSHGLQGLVATVFESAQSDGSGCALVSQMQHMQVGFCAGCHSSQDSAD